MTSYLIRYISMIGITEIIVIYTFIYGRMHSQNANVPSSKCYSAVVQTSIHLQKIPGFKFIPTPNLISYSVTFLYKERKKKERKKERTNDIQISIDEVVMKIIKKPLAYFHYILQKKS